MWPVIELAKLAASTSATVLISGETGTGKEIMAREIHNASRRWNNNFVALNCAAIPQDLIESELFGHKKGAFTGAYQNHDGLFVQAHRGTLHMDEIGDMSRGMQAKVLRVLEDNVVRVVGGIKEIKVDVRIIAASNKNLEECVEKGTFRRDLFNRLNVILLHIPSLNERREDIPALAEGFLYESARKHGRYVHAFGSKVLDTLQRQNWAGNIRELRNMVERLVILCDGDTIKMDHVRQGFKMEGKQIAASATQPTFIDIRGKTLEQIKYEAIMETVKLTGGKKSAAASLGISERGLHLLMNAYVAQNFQMEEGQTTAAAVEEAQKNMNSTLIDIRGKTLEQIKEAAIDRTLKLTGWNRKETSFRLGIALRTLCNVLVRNTPKAQAG